MEQQIEMNTIGAPAQHVVPVVRNRSLLRQFDVKLFLNWIKNHKRGLLFWANTAPFIITLVTLGGALSYEDEQSNVHVFNMMAQDSLSTGLYANITNTSDCSYSLGPIINDTGRVIENCTRTYTSPDGKWKNAGVITLWAIILVEQVFEYCFEWVRLMETL